MRIEDLAAYEIISRQKIHDLRSEGYLLRHKKSGARIALLSNEDENKVFYIGFKTPPADSTGVAHILEHSVLEGSKEFPVKDPFIELVKGSMNTFLNAMTYPDKTMYPVASCNDKDFANLMHVYMDAVFYPDIYKQPNIFYQEGWHYEMENASDELKLNGVVYNEMKGAFSSPDDVLDREIVRNLFPDTVYANESGGDPDVIPNLTYEQFLDFHRKYYHPANSYIYLYGNMDMVERLNWMDEHYLSHFEKIDVEANISLQEPFAAPREAVKPYSITESEPLEHNTYLTCSMTAGDVLNREEYIAFQILDYALCSSQGAPLKQALLDAGIGEDIYSDYDNGTRQPYFSIVAKNADASRKEEFLKIIDETLEKLVAEGLDQKRLQAGLNYYEFKYREADYGIFPAGLMYGLQVMDSWLYDETRPFIHIEAGDTYRSLREKVETGYFEQLIEKHLLHNPHRSVLLLVPERGLTDKKDQELADRLQAYKETLTAEEIEKIVEKTAALKVFQEEPDRPEDLAKIPLLERSDIRRKIEPIILEERKIEDTKLIYHKIETNGVSYFRLLFDISEVPAELFAYVGILKAAIGLVDTQNYSYQELFTQTDLLTGGIVPVTNIYPNITNPSERKITFEIKGKALDPKLDVLFAMMREILMESKLGDEKRLKEILSMLKTRLQTSFLSAGHTTAVLRSLSYTSPIARFRDITSGIGFYEVVKDLEENFEERKELLIENLKKIAGRIFRKENLMLSYTSAQEGLAVLEKAVPQFADSLHTGEKESHGQCIIHCKKRNEGFRTSSKVQYVARTGNFIDGGAEYTGALQILKVILSYDYLWQNVRVKGGAYGCMSGFNRIGEGYLVSYRDPNLEKTMEIYEGVVDYLKNFDIDDRDMNKFIIGTISNLDRPMNPAAKGSRSLNLYMNRITEEMIRREREQILDAQQEDIRGLATVLEAVLAAGELCVIGSEEKIEEAKEMFGEIRTL